MDRDVREQKQLVGWMLAVRNGRDRAAFGSLFEFFAPRLKSFVMRSGASSEEAEDIVQDVMLRVWKKAYQFDPTRVGVSGWIYQIARNRQIDLARKERRPFPLELAVETEFQEDASAEYEMSEDIARLHQALAQLNAPQREMIERAFLGELSHNEIHDLTSLPLGTIKSRIRLGLENLRHRMQKRAAK